MIGGAPSAQADALYASTMWSQASRPPPHRAIPPQQPPRESLPRGLDPSAPRGLDHSEPPPVLSTQDEDHTIAASPSSSSLVSSAPSSSPPPSDRTRSSSSPTTTAAPTLFQSFTAAEHYRQFAPLRELGRGPYSSVWVLTHPEEGELVVCKRIWIQAAPLQPLAAPQLAGPPSPPDSPAPATSAAGSSEHQQPNSNASTPSPSPLVGRAVATSTSTSSSTPSSPYGARRARTNSSSPSSPSIKELDLRAQALRRVEREVRILSSLSHPHIIKYRSCFHEGNTVCIVTDYAASGTLRHVIHSHAAVQGAFIHSECIVRWLRQLSSALSFVHSQSILHRDIKPENIFLTPAAADTLTGTWKGEDVSCTKSSWVTLV